MNSLQGKRALVTGGSAGIGRAIAAQLVAGGAQVAIAARTQSVLESAALELGATPIVADLSSAQAASQLAAEALDKLGGLDVLVLSSGIYLEGNITALAARDLSDLLGANVIGPTALAKNLVPALVASQGDVLIINSSIVRAQNIAGRAYYAAGEQAMKAIADGLRDEINALGVRVTSIYPGTTATPRQERRHRTAGKQYQPERLLQPSDVALMALAALCLPSTAEATDIYVRPRLKS
jgi:NADP-dependent 3-hydroxy acid dehydrogenase YdfG